MPFNEKYFSSDTYSKVSYSKYSQYWWSNRFYAGIVRKKAKPGTRLLEVGCGLGHLVGQLDGDFFSMGLDVNRWALLQAKNVAVRTFLQEGFAEDLPYANASFGSVIIKHVIEHLPRPERCIAELGRILAPGGLLVLSTPNLNSLLKPMKGDQWIGYRDPTHISLKPPHEWLGLLKNAGFAIDRLFADGFWDAPYIPILPRTLQKLVFGSLGGIQALSGWICLPYRWGESIIIIARHKLQ